MSNCKAVRINDEMCCDACGLTWDIKDPEPPECNISQHVLRRLKQMFNEVDEMIYRYKVTCEVYKGNEYKGVKYIFINAKHCSIAARVAEEISGYYAINTERVGVAE